ncbi:MAG: DUF6261 family protein [Tannerellaceae bacterium]|jgi:hypothetical protein|nr:DUF6261 family protein [Tannerellaceae bacterium]
MKEIKPRPTFVKKLRNAEHFDFYDVIFKHIDAQANKPATLVPEWQIFRTVFEKEDAIYKRHLRQENTELVNQAHEKRRNAYMALKRLAEAGTYSDTPAEKAAGDELIGVIDNYPDIYHAPKNEVSAMSVNLIQDLRLPKHAAAVTLLGVSNAIDRFDRDNESFIALYADRAYSVGEEKEEGSLKEARELVDNEFVNLINTINVIYRINELQQPKDAEVSAVLSDIILFINSYIYQYETIYSRRNPKYHTSGDNNKPSLPDDETPVEPSVPSIPEFSVATQEITGESAVISGYGTQMTLRAADPQAFADVLYPVAQGCALVLTYPETENSETFLIADFLFDNEGATPVGLVVNAPNSYTAFVKPFSPSGDAEAEIFLDGQLIALLLGVQFPATMSEG